MDMPLNAAVVGSRVPRDNSAAEHEKTLARVLEYAVVAGGLEAALSDEVAKEEVCLSKVNVYSVYMRRSSIHSEQERLWSLLNTYTRHSGNCGVNMSQLSSQLP